MVLSIYETPDGCITNGMNDPVSVYYIAPQVV